MPDSLNPTDEPGTLRIWVREYDVSPDEWKVGWRGNFVRLRVVTRPDRKFTFATDIEQIPLALHPQRGLPEDRPMPNAGLPIIRNIIRGKPFVSVEAARQTLQTLHLRFPEACRPGMNDQLKVHIYDKTRKPPIRRVMLEIRVNPEGRAYA